MTAPLRAIAKRIAAMATITVTADQDDTPVRGNAMDSGDAVFDKQCEDEIIARLEHDVWAWASVTVIVKLKLKTSVFEERDYLGAVCCYKDKEEFLAGEDYQDMVSNASTTLAERLWHEKAVLSEFFDTIKE